MVEKILKTVRDRRSAGEEEKKEKLKLNIAYANMPAEDLLKELSTSPSGLTHAEAKRRLMEYGYNEPAKKKKISFFRRLFAKFLNPLIIILTVIVLFSLFFGEKISAAFVFMMVLISVFLDFTLEYSSGRAVERLIEMVKTKVTVVRDGKQRDVDIREIVPGDIIDLYAGDMIPADSRIIHCKDLFINQASLTGESFPVEKVNCAISPKTASVSELTNMVFMGSSVVSGTGLGVVVKTGMATQFGKISRTLAAAGPLTSFDKGIRQFTMLMIRLILVLVVFIFLVIVFLKHGSYTEALLFSLAVAVGLTPEMLPMLVTINLSKGAISMAKKKVIVKHLNSIQNFGAMDVLCTDKTGTLTLDKIVMEKHCDVTGREDEDVLRCAYLNSFHQTGLKNLLDRAILLHEKLNVEQYQKVDEIPFDFSRKVMSVVVGTDGHHTIITKGAPEEIFPRCSRYELNGRTENINGEVLAKVKKEYDSLSREGFRVLAVAYKDIWNKKAAYSKDDEKDLVLKGYVAFLDPAKPSTKEVLVALKELGVEIKILTGDNEIITRKIANDVGLEIKGLATGAEVDMLKDPELEQLVEKTTIFARLAPMQKERVIRALRANQHTVGYLGDGINDAPSLKTSDVGISVNNAVDIAKESADIILLEKSLMVLQAGVLDGRKVFGNIIKYIKMGASSNFGNMLSMTGAVLFLPFLPMLPIQVLLNNFLYDMSQVTLPTDEVDSEYLAKPRPWNVDFIRKFILFIGPLSSIYDFLTFGVMLFVFHASPELFHTGWFLESLFTQTLVIYIIRTNKIPFVESRPSRSLVVTTVLILMAACSIVFSSLAKIFGFVALPPLYFLILAAMVATYLLLVQFVKTRVVKKYGYQ